MGKSAAMATDIQQSANLERVRTLERRRVAATGANDADALDPLLDDSLIYINSICEIYGKQQYLGAIRSHALTYDEDFDVVESDCRLFDDIVILAGVMLGHARLEGERQVFRSRCLSVWRRAAGEWRMIAWQSSYPSGSDVLAAGR